MRFVTRKRLKAPVINITSLIDVVFLLVIFLMLAAKFEPEGGIGVDLPKGQSAEVPKERVFDLVIVHDGTMYLNKETVVLDDLAAHIQAKRKELGDPVLVIRADKAVPWERIVAVTDVAKQAGQGKVNFKIKP